MLHESEAMPNSLGAQQDGIVQLRVLATVGLARVQVNLEFVAKLHFHGQHLLQEVVDGLVVVFFVHHVEATYHVGHFVSLDDSIELLLDVVTAKHLESADDQSHPEEWESLLEFLFTVLEDLNFLFEWNDVAIVVKDAAKDVPVLNDCAHFTDEVTRDSVQDALKERLVVVKLERDGKLMLEVLPDKMVLFHVIGRSESHLVSDKLVKFGGILPILAQSVHLDVALLVAAFLRHMEIVLTLRVVNTILVGQVNKIV